jgi:ABC-type Fe3+-siderophore transport system permease subunit
MSEKFVPFESIGLCFSGGGYRATFFSLGVVSYLNKIKHNGNSLLDSVEALSTVSGGTLLGAAFANATLATDYTFEGFYNDFYNSFKPENDTLLQRAIKILEDDEQWEHSHKKKSLINAFSLAYAEMNVFQGALKHFNEKTAPKLKRVCFNATDFSYGLAFRFQNKGLFGNKALQAKEVNKIKYDTKLADIIASSSCFPMGFEPLVYPDDYYKHDTAEYKALKKLPKFKNGVGIMDGGITDNQGIGSMVNISKLKGRKKPLDLIIVNDVGSYKMIPWQAETTEAETKKTLQESLLKILRYFRFRWIYWTVLLVGILILVGNALQLISKTPLTVYYIIGGILTGIGLSISILGALLLKTKNKGVHWFKKLFKKTVPEVLASEVRSFQNLDMGLLKRMGKERISSTIKMVSDVFLKQLRRLNYDLIYASKDLKNKIITSTIYELNGQKTPYTRGFNTNKEIESTPSKQLKDIALTASETPTTLWWDKTDIATNRMDALIACGQFTTCYNLMDYILQLKKQEIVSKELDELYQQLTEDWIVFNKNPKDMV